MRKIIVLGLFLAGCASAPTVTPPQHRVGEAPALNTLTERSVGEVIYETYNYQEWSGAKLSVPLTIDVFAAGASLAPTTALLPAKEADGSEIFCTTEALLEYAGGGSRVCLLDRNKDSAFEEWRAPEGPPARMTWAPLKTPAPYTTGRSAAPSSGFRYELVYQGLAGSVVSLLYREYQDDFARPAFQQDLTYTLSPEGTTEISFRGTRIVIEHADNNGIRYRVLSGLKTS